MREVSTMMNIQLMLYCALFTLMVKLGVGNDPLNGLFFYPKPVQDKVYALGLTDRQTVGRKRKRFMIAFFTVMAAALVLIVRQALQLVIPAHTATLITIANANKSFLIFLCVFS